MSAVVIDESGYNAHDEEEAQAKKAIGDSHFTAKRYDQAADAYTNLIQDHSFKVASEIIRIVKCNRAACYLELGKYDLAVEDCNQVISSATAPTAAAPITRKAHLRLARSLQRMSNLYEALRVMDELKDLVGEFHKTEDVLKDEIIEEKKRRDKTVQPEPNSRGDGCSWSSPGPVRSFKYEVHVLNHPPIVFDERVPAALCGQHPPEIATTQFLSHLAKKYEQQLLQKFPGSCWNCTKPAVGMVRNPMCYLHQPEPMILDISQPVCENGGPCDGKAREDMAREMAFCMQSSR